MIENSLNHIIPNFKETNLMADTRPAFPFLIFFFSALLRLVALLMLLTWPCVPKNLVTAYPGNYCDFVYCRIFL